MDTKDYINYEDSKTKTTTLLNANETVRKTGMATLGTMFSLASNWKERKIGMQMFTLMFNALQYGDAVIKKLSLDNSDSNFPTTEESPVAGMRVSDDTEQNWFRGAWDRARHQRDDRTTTRITKVGLFAGGPSGGTASGPV